MMKSIEKLRKLREQTIDRDVDNPLWVCEQARQIADEIEREISERYMELPVDADGVPIHVGDELETGEYGKRFTCTGYSYQTEGYEKPHWSIAYRYDDYDGTTEFVSLRSCRHVKPRTIEDVLDDFARAQNYLHVDHHYKGITDYNELRAQYATEIRELLGVEK